LAALNRADIHDEFELKLLDLATGKQCVVRHPPGHSFTSLAFTVDGRLFVIGTPDHKRIKLWEVSLPKSDGK
jgi:hypothetical protein